MREYYFIDGIDDLKDIELLCNYIMVHPLFGFIWIFSINSMFRFDLILRDFTFSNWLFLCETEKHQQHF